MEDKNFVNLVVQSSEVTCTLNPNQLETRREEILKNLVKNIKSKKFDKNGYSLDFPYHSDLAHNILDFILKEQQCCSFFKFQVNFDIKSNQINLQIRSETVDSNAIKNVVEALLT